MKILLTYKFFKIIKGIYKYQQMNKSLHGVIKGTHTINHASIESLTIALIGQ
jgi:hypothetical protein